MDKPTEGECSWYEKWSLWTDAQWWQFWLPQSGFIGGSICGVLILTIVGVVLWLW